MWDPTTYLRFTDQRSRPFHDLLARVDLRSPRAIVDLGCGPGHLTGLLAQRWPDAQLLGIDSDPAMIARAQADHPGLNFRQVDVRDWQPGTTDDLIVTNAVLQWVPEHVELLLRWTRQLSAGATIACQVPANHDSPAHRLLRELAVSYGAPTDRRAVPTPEQYARTLTAAGCAVDAWETSYLHVLPADGPHHPVLSWLEGTGLLPVRATLDDACWEQYRDNLGERLATEYPVIDGMVYYPFRRVFVVARTGAGQH